MEWVKYAVDQFGQDDQLALAFNGGKDCTAVLDLVHQYTRKSVENPTPLLVCYVTDSSSVHSEVDHFVRSVIVQRYSIRLCEYSTSLKEAFAQFIRDHPTVKAILSGVRRTDPFSAQLQHCQFTDNGWPHFLRIHPILDWSYAQVWEYLLHPKSYLDSLSFISFDQMDPQYSVPYCSLYDRGYSSIGKDPISSRPNEALRRNCSACAASGVLCEHFNPAYMLQDESLERSGRS